MYVPITNKISLVFTELRGEGNVFNNSWLFNCSWPKLDDFLHAAFRAGLYRVWVVHGKGSGVLRQEVGRYLSKHPLVRLHRLADRYHGGIGATQVELSEY